MIKLNINERKSLSFQIELSGIDHSQLEGSLRFIVDNVEYGFPAKIEQGLISVDIPTLANIIPRDIEEGEKLQAKLEVQGNGYYMNPWNGEFIAEIPIKIEAKIIETETPKKPSVKVVTPKVTKTKEPIKESEEDVKTKSEKLVAKKLKSMENLIENKLRPRRNPLKKPVPGGLKKPTPAGPSPKLSEKPRECSEEDIFRLIESVGIKKESTKQSILERAKEMSGDLDSTYDVVSKMLGAAPTSELEMIQNLVDRKKK